MSPGPYAARDDEQTAAGPRPVDEAISGHVVEFEFSDGSCAKYSAADQHDAWDLVRLVDPVGDEIVSAWRDGEPWFGICTDMREGVA